MWNRSFTVSVISIAVLSVLLSKYVFLIINSGTVSIFSCSILLPIYTLAEARKFEGFTLQDLTINRNDEKSPIIIWVVFFFTVVFSMLGHILIYFFEEKKKVLPSLYNKDSVILTDTQVSQHTVLIQGISKTYSPKDVQAQLARIFKCDSLADRANANDAINSNENMDGLVIHSDLASRVIHIQVTGDYYEMLNILTKLERSIKKKEHFEQVYDDGKGKLIRKKKSFGAEGPPLKDYYAQKPLQIKRKMTKELEKTKWLNMGIAFIVFDSNQAQKSFIKCFQDSLKSLKTNSEGLYYKLNARSWSV